MPRPRTQIPKIRITLDFTVDLVQALNRISDEEGRSRTEVMADALRLYARMKEESQDEASRT